MSLIPQQLFQMMMLRRFLTLQYMMLLNQNIMMLESSIAATPFDQPSCFATGTGLLGLAAITANQISTGPGTDQKADTAGRKSRHASAAELQVLARYQSQPSCPVN